MGSTGKALWRVTQPVSRGMLIPLVVALLGTTVWTVAPAWAGARLIRLHDEIEELRQAQFENSFNPMMQLVAALAYGIPARNWTSYEEEIQDLVNQTINVRARITMGENGIDPIYGTVEPLGSSNNSTFIRGLGYGTEVTAAGYSETGNMGDYHAITWTLSGGTVDLGTLPGGDSSQAFGISANAAVVVGGATTPGVTFGSVAFRWTAADHTMTNLGSLYGPTGHSQANAVDGDGAIVTGVTDVANSEPGTTVPMQHAFRWVVTPGLNTGVMTDLDPTYAFTSSSGRAISLDGSVIVGSTAERTSGTEAMMWTAASGMVALPTLSGQASMIANSVSGDGKIVVGTASTDTFVQPEGRVDINNVPITSAFRWTAAGGTQDLATLLVGAGVDMTGTKLMSATGISDDGQFISGTASFPNMTGDNQGEPYIIRYCDATNALACTTDGVVDHPVVGMTGQDEIEASLAATGDEYHAVGAHLGATAGLLLGDLQPVEGAEGGGPFASVGSFTLGASGRKTLGDGFSVLGGAAFVDQSAGGASVNGSALFGAAVRYVHPVPLTDARLRPFAEAGVWGSPSLNMHFSRTYANGSSTATGEGDASGSVFAGYVRGGVLYAPTVDDEVAFSATLGGNLLNVGAYAEASTPSNPFPASFAAQSIPTGQLKATVGWTHHVSENLDFTLTGSIGRSFGRTPTSANVVGFGGLSGTAGDYTFGELGARVDYTLNDTVQLNAFALGTFGDTIGTHLQVGGGLSVKF